MNSTNRIVATGVFALASAAGLANAGVGDSFIVSVQLDAWSWSTEVNGEFVDNNTYVAFLDLSEFATEFAGTSIDLSGAFVEYRATGENLRMGGGAQTVNLNFNVSAGFANTSFGFAAAPVSFAAFPSATGEASASVSLTSFFTGGTGATLSPDAAGAYKASYNAGASTFADLFGAPLSVATNSTTQTFDAAASGPLFGPVGDIGSSWDFTLTAFDSASGTSTFTVVPTPAAAALLGLGGLVGLRRRR